MIKTLKDFNFNNKRVILRCDLNVPILIDDSNQRIILDDFRIKQSIPTIKYLIKQNAKIIIISHLGDPCGKIDDNLKLDLIQEKLTKFLKIIVKKNNDCLGSIVEKDITKMKKGEILLLENIRFYKEEEEGNEKFAEKLSKLGDIYINDAFGVSHRNHSSIALLPKYLPSGAGYLLEKEIKVLSGVLNNPLRPLVAIIGGIKILTKIKVIKKFLEISDNLLLGGGIANTILSAKGILNNIPLLEEKILKEISKLDLTNFKIHIPVDGIISSNDYFLTRKGAIGTTKKNEEVYDIGPDTIKIFKKIIKEAKMIIWNGPLGFFESKKFQKGTKEIILEIVKNKKAFKVVGGGETVLIINNLNLLDKFDHVSTGGGAMLEFLSGKELPGIKALEI